MIFLIQFLDDVVQDDIPELLFGVFFGFYLVENVLVLWFEFVESGFFSL